MFTTILDSLLNKLQQSQEAMESAVLRRSRGLVMIYAMDDPEALEYREANRQFKECLEKIKDVVSNGTALNKL